MPWAIVAASVASFYAADMKPYRDIGQVALNELMAQPVKSTRPSKCQSCGSREFKHHNSVLVCSYCRCQP